MTCNLSKNLKKQIHESVNILKSRLVVKVKQYNLVETLIGEGWLFKTEKIYHPHNSDLIEGDMFKSPRMSGFCHYNPGDDILIREATYVARSAASNINLNGAVVSLLTEYYRVNNKLTTSQMPEIIIKLGEIKP